MKKHIPNIITSCNLLCGCIAITFVAKGQLVPAALFVIAAAIFDFFDGLSARLLKVSSPIGAQLDSLADAVSFGVVPAYIAFHMIQELSTSIWLPYLAFIIAAYSAYRLAKFNVDERQSESFIGLPTPANALFWISIPLIGWQNETSFYGADSLWLYDFIHQTSVLLVLSFLLSYLLIAEIPMLSLKFKTLGWTENKMRFLLLGFSSLLIGIFFFAAIPFILLLYFILSIIENSVSRHEIQSRN